MRQDATPCFSHHPPPNAAEQAVADVFLYRCYACETMPLRCSRVSLPPTAADDDDDLLLHRRKTTAVFVGNLPWSTTDEDLQQIFAPYEPYDCHVKTNMAGRSRGFGILR